MFRLVCINSWFPYFQAKGKIVVFNAKWVNYGTSVIYRAYGAAEVAKVGGVASLIRSVTPFSIYSPHTGWQVYEQGNLSIGIFNSEILRYGLVGVEVR